MATEMWKRIRTARKAAGLTQINIARAMGITRSGYAFLEWARPDGRTHPSAAQVQTISRLTRVPVEMLMSDETTEADVWRVATRAAAGGVGYEPADAPPLAAAAAPDDRTRENFWRAVEYSVTLEAPDLAGAFARPVGPLGTTADFVAGRRLVQFGGAAARLRDHVANLLLAEAAVHRQCDKHLLIWGPDMTEEIRALSPEIATAYGVRVHEVADGHQAARLILSLRS